MLNDPGVRGNEFGHSDERSIQDTQEPFVSAEIVAEFLSIERRMVLDWARSGTLPAHPLGYGRKRIWRFRLSEVEAAVLGSKKPVKGTISSGSLRSQRSKSNG